jgi:hypothetical protein
MFETKINPAHILRLSEINCIWRHLAARERLQDDLRKALQAPKSKA